MTDLGDALDSYRRLCGEFRWQLPAEFNFGRDVVDRYAADPGRPALLWRDVDGATRNATFADVAAASDRVAGLLADLGVAAGEPVILMLPKVPEWHVVSVGALKAGVLLIPSSTLLRPKDVAYRANHSGAVAIVASGEARAAADAVRAECPTVRHFLELCPPGSPAAEGWQDLGAALGARAVDAPVGRPTAASDPALVYYTSGTTGPPKAVLHTHAYTWAHRYTARFWHGAREGDRLWTTSDTGWAKAAYGVLFGPWSLGVEVVLYAGRFDPATELQLLGELAPQVFCAPPTEFRMLVKQDLSRFDLSSLRECVSAGEPLNPEVIRAWRDATGITIRDGYGQTESILLIGNFPGVPVQLGSMGLAMPGHRIEVIDESGGVVPPDEVGEIAIHGRPPGMYREYWKDPGATARARLGEWTLTGDRAMRDEDGYFWFVGRNDDVIISAGYRIGPFEVESALLEHPDVVEAAAVAAPDPDRGAVVKAYVVLREGATPGDDLVAALQDHVKQVTAPYKYPRIVEFVDELPKTVSGKIRRVELRERSTSV